MVTRQWPASHTDLDWSDQGPRAEWMWMRMTCMYRVHGHGGLGQGWDQQRGRSIGILLFDSDLSMAF